MRLTCKRLVGFLLLFAASSHLLAQKSTNNNQAGTEAKSAKPKVATNGVKPFDEVIKADAVTTKGLFTVHKQDDHYYFEISESLVNRDILVVNRISRSATGARSLMEGYAGDEIGENVVRFDKGPSNKLFLRTVSFWERGTDTSENGMYRSVLNSNIQPIIAAFDIKAFHADSISNANAILIDVTDFVNGDNNVLFFETTAKKAFNLGSIIADRSYIDTIRTYAGNIEIRTIKTYNRAPIGSGFVPPPATFELNSSLLLLPEKPMKPRFSDERVGYFSAGYRDFDADPQGVKEVSMITRWKLEPKPEDIRRYLAGELVEPKKQIVYYIDPTTPKKWVPYLIAGVNDWNKAFEAAGWKNAIVAKEAPTDDPSWSIDDASHSAIVYKPSTIPNASGPHVHDPRTGEILETHINWFHNVMSLLHDWYFVQAAAIDQRARTMEFSDSLMGDLVRFVSSHEVGHTLGLMHNFGSSSTVPVELLRNKAWVEKNGHTPSIMDYARFNYVAQPEDNISPIGIYPRINDYDKWAIQWGYRWFPDSQFKDQKAEKAYLTQWLTDSLTRNHRLWYGPNLDGLDPRTQSEDLGDNAMLASTYGIKNLKRILANMMEWTATPYEGYANQIDMYKQITTQFSRYMKHVTLNLGGIYTTRSVQEQNEPSFEFVSKAKQKEAMKFLRDQLFITPMWLLNKEAYMKTGVGGTSMFMDLQKPIIDNLLSGMTLTKFLTIESIAGNETYTVSEMLEDLKNACFSELKQKSAIDVYRRNLQKLYVNRLVEMLTADPKDSKLSRSEMTAIANKNTDAISIMKGHAGRLEAEIKVAIATATDPMTKMHLKDIYDRLHKALNP